MEILDWNVAAASNNAAPPNGFPENMAYSAVNDSARELMAVVRRFIGDNNGSLTSGGSANAYTLTPNGTYSAYAAGQSFVFKASFANTGAATLNVSALGAKSIVLPNGAALASGDIPSGSLVAVGYDGTNFVLRGLLAKTTTASSAIDHDATTNFVANEHVDHSAVSISAGTGLTGGGTIASSRTISLSHLGLQDLADPNADRIAFWDDSASAFAWLTVGTGLSISGTTLSATAGATKSGVFHRSTDQGLIVSVTKVQWNATTHNDLAKGTMDLSSNYRYTASATVLVQVNVNVYVTDLDSGDEAFVELRKNGSAIRRGVVRNDSGSGPYPRHISFSTCVSLVNTDYLEVFVTADTDGVYVEGGASYSSFEIIELPG